MEKNYKYCNGIAVEPAVINDVVIVKRYGDNVIKVSQVATYPNKRKLRYDATKDIYRKSVIIDDVEYWEDEIAVLPNGSICFVKDLPEWKPKCSVNNNKLLNNLARAKQKILEISLCNDFDLFATFTIDRKKYNRYDLEKYHKAFSQFIRNFNRNHKTNIKYLLVPERHKDGAWHEHGFIQGLPIDMLTQYNLGDRMNKSLADKVKKGDVVYKWAAYAKSFGFCALEKIRSRENAGYYMTKYITKDLANTVSKLGGHLYYSSQKLKKAEVIAKGEYTGNFVYSYMTDFIKCQTLAYDNDIVNNIVSRIDDKGYFDLPELTADDKARGLYIPGEKDK